MTHRERTVRNAATLLNFMKMNKRVWDEEELRKARKILYQLYDAAYDKKEREVIKQQIKEYYYGNR